MCSHRHASTGEDTLRVPGSDPTHVPSGGGRARDPYVVLPYLHDSESTVLAHDAAPEMILCLFRYRMHLWVVMDRNIWYNEWHCGSSCSYDLT
jgi:hypothetical protein